MPNFESDEGAPSASLAERIDDALIQLDRYRQRPVVTIAAIGSVLGLVVLAWWLARPSDRTPVEDLIPSVALAPTALPEILTEPLVVHVTGEVQSPGVFSLPAGSRVLDAVDAAGGGTTDADLHQLNLAAGLSDGSKIRVPPLGESPTSPAADLPLVTNGSGGGVDVSGGAIVNINMATAAELQNLPGVGPATAQSIVAFRDQHGAFGSTEGLLGVAGIGPSKLAALQDHVVVR